ncbi:2'-5' RNA ligase family protein [Ottowia thiooxydans]|uniref:2'-5' RNA ligase family protein n=1 Tax=Ottowia thiooxydans TaxID=219182 RepID=UPI0012EC5C6E|nr:2'-5' RNA ligase family protein [Ottowia thiooxydans]
MLATTLVQGDLFGDNPLPEPAPPRRLLTMLFPDAQACAAIDAERQRWLGHPRELYPIPERMHITFQSFNQVDWPHERDWLIALKELRFEPFEIALAHAELWDASGQRIAVLLPEPSAELAELHLATARLARRAGLPAETRAWVPHLTTLRGAKKTKLQPLTQAIRWRVSHIDWIWSELKPKPLRYHRLGQFGAH